MSAKDSGCAPTTSDARVVDPLVTVGKNGQRSVTASHRWDVIRERKTCITTPFLKQLGPDNIGTGLHESLLRSYHVLAEVRAMLDRGDSTETISAFIDWCEGGARPEGRAT